MSSLMTIYHGNWGGQIFPQINTVCKNLRKGSYIYQKQQKGETQEVRQNSIQVDKNAQNMPKRPKLSFWRVPNCLFSLNAPKMPYLYFLSMTRTIENKLKKFSIPLPRVAV